MGSEVILPQISGFIVPFLDAEEVLTTNGVESNPSTREVTPTGGTSSSLAFTPSGDPGEGRTMRLRVQRAGVPSGAGGLALAWKNSIADDWIGADSFGVPTATRLVAWSTSTSLGYEFPSVVALPSGVLVCAFDEPITTSRRAVKCRRWDPETMAWDAASTDIYSEPANNVAYGAHPALCVLPSGRILCFHLKYAASTFAQVWLWWSDDEGLTWTRGQVNCLGVAIDYGAKAPRCMRVAYGRGEIALVVTYDDAGTGKILHYASRDGGAKFNLIETLVKPALGGPPVAGSVVQAGLAFAKGQFVLIASDSVKGADEAIWRGGSASDLWSTIQDGGFMPDVFHISDHCALCADEAENLYLITGYGQGGICFSSDAGSSWARLAATNGQRASQWCPPAATCDVVYMTAIYHRGRIAILGNVGGATPKFGIVEFQLGGFTTVTHPIREPDDDLFGTTQPSTRIPVPWGIVWFGSRGALTGSGFTNADTGTPTYGYTGGYEAIACGAGDVAIAEIEDAAPDPYAEILAFASLQQSTGTSEITVRGADTGGGGQFTRIVVTVGTTSITLSDDLGASTVVAVYAAGERIDVLVALKGRKASVWYRIVDGDLVRRWILVGSLTGLTESAGAPPDSRVRRIVNASSIAAFHEFRTLFEDLTISAKPFSEGLADGFSSPTDLEGRPAVGLVGGAYIDDGVSMQVTDGPGLAGETFVMFGGGSHPVEWCLPAVAPSPQMFAELENQDDLDLEFAWEDIQDPGNDLLGAYLDCAAYAAELWIDEGVGESKIADLVTSWEAEFVRHGKTLRSVEGIGSAGNLGYIEENELAGGWVVLDPEGDDTVRLISGNTAGRFDDEATIDEKRCTIYLSGIDNTEAFTGVVRIIPPRSAHAVALVGHRDIQRIIIRLNPTNLRTGYPAPPWGTVRVRVLNVGPIAALGWSPARDHSVQRESLVNVVDLPSGARWSRRMNNRTRRIVEFSVSSDGIDIGKNRGSGDTDGYVRASQSSGSEPIAARHDAPLLLQGLIDHTDGPGLPVTWIPAWDPAGEDEQSWFLQHAGGAVHGRITSEARLESVVGHPHADQVVRGPRIVLEEEL